MPPFARMPDILEVTLRDGSYLVDFQFTAEDTAMIASALEATGFRWIEVGHGLGLNASNCGKGVAAATDWEYVGIRHDCGRRVDRMVLSLPHHGVFDGT